MSAYRNLAQILLKAQGRIDKETNAAIDVGENVSAIRDEMRRLRALLREAATELHYRIENEYPEDARSDPKQMRRYQLEMDFVRTIDAELQGNRNG
jgi:hypothetical protein